jgi:hypothetical protein
MRRYGYKLCMQPMITRARHRYRRLGLTRIGRTAGMRPHRKLISRQATAVGIFNSITRPGD